MHWCGVLPNVVVELRGFSRTRNTAKESVSKAQNNKLQSVFELICEYARNGHLLAMATYWLQFSGSDL